MRNVPKFAIALTFSATAWAAVPTVIQPTDLLTNSRLTINSNFLGLYNGSSGLIDCSGTTGSFVVTLNGGGTLPICRTLTWANILALSGTPATFVTSWNSRSGAVTLGQSDVAAVEQDLRNTASPNFVGLGLGGNLSVTGTSLLTGAVTMSGALAVGTNQTIAGNLNVTGSITGGSYSGGIVPPASGGSGINNGTFTFTLGGNTTFAGAFNPTFVIPSSSTWTFPAAGTLIGSGDTGTVTNTMLAGSIAPSQVTGTAATLGANAFTSNQSFTGSGQAGVTGSLVAVIQTDSTHGAAAFDGATSAPVVTINQLSGSGPALALIGGELLAPTINFSNNEGGSNNAISCASGCGPALVTGLEITIQLAHTLQAGANTFAYSGGSALAIKSHFNTSNNIATAYAATGIIRLQYNGSLWVDESQ